MDEQVDKLRQSINSTLKSKHQPLLKPYDYHHVKKLIAHLNSLHNSLLVTFCRGQQALSCEQINRELLKQTAEIYPEFLASIKHQVDDAYHQQLKWLQATLQQLQQQSYQSDQHDFE